MEIDEVVTLSVKHNVSDLHLCPRQPARWRRQGRLELCPFTAPTVASVLDGWLTPCQRYALEHQGLLDFAVTFGEDIRLRGHAFNHCGGGSLALRFLPTQLPTLDALAVPVALRPLLHCKEGLILVVGATGSGKSTTLAAMIDYQNQHIDGHIITLEDPIEFIHCSHRALIQQGEVDKCLGGYRAGLNSALRADPDIIMLGELREASSMRQVLSAAETGHLVMATLHTGSSVQALERVIDAYPAQEKAAARAQLSSVLHAVLAQRLIPDGHGGRVAIYELLLNTPAVANLLREGKWHQLPSVLASSQYQGMQTFAYSLAQRDVPDVEVQPYIQRENKIA